MDHLVSVELLSLTWAANTYKGALSCIAFQNPFALLSSTV